MLESPAAVTPAIPAALMLAIHWLFIEVNTSAFISVTQFLRETRAAAVRRWCTRGEDGQLRILKSDTRIRWDYVDVGCGCCLEVSGGDILARVAGVRPPQLTASAGVASRASKPACRKRRTGMTTTL